MPPRKRKAENADLPPNVYTSVTKGVTYFYYEHPITHQCDELGKDKASAIRTGQAINAALARSGVDFRTRTPVIKGMTMAELVADYKRTQLPKYKQGVSRKNHKNLVERVADQIGRNPIAGIQVVDLAKAFRDLPDTVYIKTRTALVKLFAHALAQGYMPHHLGNPADHMEKRSEPKVKRQRLSLDDYRRIRDHEQTPPYLKTTMELIMQTTMRECDAVRVKFAHERNGVLYTKIRKTGKIQGLKLRPAAQAVIQRARQSGIASPYVVHTLPLRHRGKQDRSVEKDHPTQLTTDQVSRKFSEIRDLLEIGKGKPGTPPTLYEVRSLSAREYKAAGENKKNVQALLAHTDEEMTELYWDERDLESALIVAEAGLEF